MFCDFDSDIYMHCYIKKMPAVEPDVSTSFNSDEMYTKYKEFNFFEKLEDTGDYEEIEKLNII